MEYKEPLNYKLFAVCGISCRKCNFFKANIEQVGGSVTSSKATICQGCRSQIRCQQCEECIVFDCAWEKGHDFCWDCPDYPCAKLKVSRLVKG